MFLEGLFLVFILNIFFISVVCVFSNVIIKELGVGSWLVVVVILIGGVYVRVVFIWMKWN